MSLVGEHTWQITPWTPRAGILCVFMAPGVGDVRPIFEAAHPQAHLFFRAWLGDWQPDRTGWDIVAEVDRQLGSYRNPRLCIQLYVGPDQGQTNKLLLQISQAVQECRKRGLRLAAPSFYTGQPEPAFWQAMAAANWCGMDPAQDVISVQEYTNTKTANSPGNIFRYPAVWEAGWTGAVAALEFGFDNGSGKGGGWQGKMSEDQVYQLCADTDTFDRQHPKFLGRTWFNAPGWDSFGFSDPRGQLNYEGGSTPMPDGNGQIIFSDFSADLQAALVKEGDMTVMEARQNGLLTDLIKQIRTGNWTGPGSVDGIYCALKGGIAAPDYTPSYPPNS